MSVLYRTTPARVREKCEPARDHILARSEEVTKLLFLGLEIFFGVLAGSDFAGYTFHNLHSGPFQGMDLVGIIGEQAHTGNAQRFQNFAGEREVAVVGFETETLVGFDGIEAGILEFVGLELGHQADAASLLLLVDQDAGPFLGNHGERKLELLAAVATQGMKDVSSEALGMDPHEGRRGMHITHDQCYRFINAAMTVVSGLGAETVDTESSPTRGKLRGSYLLNFAGHVFIIVAEECEVVSQRSKLSDELTQDSLTPQIAHARQFCFSGL